MEWRSAVCPCSCLDLICSDSRVTAQAAIKKKPPSVNHMTGWLQMRNLTIRIMATAEQPDEAELRFIIVSSFTLTPHLHFEVIGSACVTWKSTTRSPTHSES